MARYYDLWLGISDEIQEGVWLGDDGNPITWFNWNHGEPNNWAGGEHWVEMELNSGSRASRWNDFFSVAIPTGRIHLRENQVNENKVICTFIVPKNF